MSVRLRLRDLPDQCQALASNHVADKVDAARVMLDKFHSSPKTGEIEDPRGATPVEFDWDSPDPRLMETHANELDATEDGAYAVAFSTMVSRSFVVRRRAHHGSGSDYLITRSGEPANDFFKLEVSGVARGKSALKQRLASKLRQLGKGDLTRPGIAVVVGFEAARVLIGEHT